MSDLLEPLSSRSGRAKHVNTIERCGDCYWRNKDEGEGWRYPPVPQAIPQPRALGGMDTVIIGLHPPVPETSWCGEFRPRVEA